MNSRTHKATISDRQGRMRIAEQFHTAAELIEEFTGEAGESTINNAYVTLCVHAGIAAADVICSARLGEYALGEDHKAAAALLTKIDKTLGQALARLLALKTPAEYQPNSVSRQHVLTAKRQSDRLVFAARENNSS